MILWVPSLVMLDIMTYDNRPCCEEFGLYQAAVRQDSLGTGYILYILKWLVYPCGNHPSLPIGRAFPVHQLTGVKQCTFC